MLMEVHGHRGCRGYYPENTIEGFLFAVEMGCSAIELDVVVTKDKQLLVSHEPWMNYLFCTTPAGEGISKGEEGKYNIFDMTLEEAQMFGCGRRKDEAFPEQLKKKAKKPSLQRVLDVLKPFDVRINIEVKSEESWVGIFQPNVVEYATLLVNLIEENELYKTCMVQSFDRVFLNTFQPLLSKAMDIGLLVEGELNIEQNLKALNFQPTYFNPEYVLLDDEVLTVLHQKGIRVLVWTVNSDKEIQNMINLGVDGIISDYPDNVLRMLNKKSR